MNEHEDIVALPSDQPPLATPAGASPNTAPQENETTPEAPRSKRRWMIGLTCLTLVAVAAGIGAYALWPRPSTTTQTTQKQPLVKISGEVAIVDGDVQKQTTGSWKSISVGDTIQQGDVVRTGKEARAVINLDDGSAVRLDADSMVAFLVLSNQKITLEQRAGRAYHRVHKGSLVYVVRTLTAEATALGTSFSTETNTEQSLSEIVVLESKVRVKSSTINEDVTVSEGQVAVVQNKSQTIEVVATPQDKLAQEYFAWNAALDQGKTYTKPTPTPTPIATPTPSATPKPTVKPTATPVGTELKLSGQKGAGKVSLTWSFNGSAPQGFKVIRSLNAFPTYPTREGDEAKYLDSASARNFTWGDLDNRPYHFRVGVYKDGAITMYSNDITVVPDPAPTKQTASKFAGSITASATPGEAGMISVTWSVANGTSSNGFKVVWGTAANPTYPGSSAQYVGGDATQATVKYLNSGDTIHVRVGAYDSDGTVTVYSNDVTVVVP